MYPTYTLNDLLNLYKDSLFNMNVSLSLPRFFSKKSFKKAHTTHVFEDIQHHIHKMSEKKREAVINEFLEIYLPHRNKNATFYTESAKFKDPKILLNEFRPYLSKMSSLPRKDQDIMLFEATKYLQDQVLTIRHALLNRDVIESNTRDYILVLQALETIHIASKDLLKRIGSEDKEYLSKLQTSMLTLLLAIEALRRKELTPENFSRLITKHVNQLDQTDFSTGKEDVRRLTAVLA